MSLNQKEIALLAEEAAALLSGQIMRGCEELAGSRFILLFEQSSLLFSFEEPFLRFHLTDKKGSSPKTAFVRTLQEHLSGAALSSLAAQAGERILIIDLFHPKKRERYSLVAEFFSKKSNCLLLDGNGALLAALRPRNPGSKPAFQPTPPRYKNSRAVESAYDELEAAEARRRIERQLERERAKQEKRKARVREELEQARDWERYRHEGELLQANLYRIAPRSEAVTLEDWAAEGALLSLTLDPTITPHENAALRFRKSKKLQKAIPHLEELLKKEEQKSAEIARLIALLQDKGIAAYEELLPPPTEKKRRPSQEKSLPYREYLLSSGARLWVGKNSASNELLTFRYANGDDWWFHASGASGSHVVLRLPSRRQPTEEELYDALQLALAHSKLANEGAGEVTMTQRKYLSRQGQKKKGTVAVSHHKKRFVKADPERLKELRASQPSSLKR